MNRHFLIMIGVEKACTERYFTLNFLYYDIVWVRLCKLWIELFESATIVILSERDIAAIIAKSSTLKLDEEGFML